MKLLKVERFGTEVQGVRIEGDPRSPEPLHFRIVFPGGDIDLVRCDDASYWAHVRVDGPSDVREERASASGEIVDARIDFGSYESRVVPEVGQTIALREINTKREPRGPVWARARVVWQDRNDLHVVPPGASLAFQRAVRRRIRGG